MKDLVIIGTGSFARLLYAYLDELDERKVAAFSVEKDYIPETGEFCGLPVYPLEELEGRCPPETFDVILGVGHSKMNQVREKLFRLCKAKGYAVASFIHPTAVIPRDAELGEGNLLFENFVMLPFCKIGDGNLFWDNASIAHDSVVGSFNTFSGHAALAGFCEVGDHCYMGKSSFLFDHVKLADYTLVGAGAYVRHDTKPYDVIVPEKCVTLEGRSSLEFDF